MPRKDRILRVAPAAAELFDCLVLDETNGLIISAGTGRRSKDEPPLGGQPLRFLKSTNRAPWNFGASL